jgi:hypothetical protein
MAGPCRIVWTIVKKYLWKSRSIRSKIEYLGRTGHPKWREVDLDEGIGTWQFDACSQKSPASRVAQPEKLKTYQDKFRCTIYGKCWRNDECVSCP